MNAITTGMSTHPEEAVRPRGDEGGVEDADVCVFSPAPMLTVTVEEGAGEAPEIHLHAGGQGFWVARMVARLGATVTLCGCFGGETGAVVRTLIAGESVSVRAVPCQASNGAYIHDRREGDRNVLAEAPGGSLSRHELDDLYGATLVAAIAAGVCVVTGSAQRGVLPPDAYRRLATDLNENSVTVIGDLSGEALKATLAGGMSLLKISDEELIADGYAASMDVGDVVAGIERLHEAGAKNVVVSRADEPTIAWVAGEMVEAIPPRLELVDASGGGDSMTAALAVAVSRGLDVQDALRLSSAAAGLNVTRRGLATGHREDIERLAREVTVREMS